MNRNDLLETAIQAAREAGGIALAMLDQPQRVMIKGPRDVVTEADLRCQERITEVISRRFPDHGFMGEEAGLSQGTSSDYCWIIDPIDGTTNYSRRYPGFSISIGLSHSGDLILGVVYDPLRDQLFQAERGRGTHLNGEPMHVSQTARLADAVVGAEWARDPGLRQRSVEYLARLAPKVMTMRSLGSAALTMCHVAAGYLDLYVHLSLTPYDVAAAGLIIEEAGGMITNTDGDPWNIHSGHILASNGLLHQAALEVLKS